MMARRIAGLLIVAAAVLAAGCQRNQTIESSGGAPREVQAPQELVAQGRPPVPDIPVPIGFKLDEKKSRNLAAAGLRWVIHQYTGRPSKYAVARFYRKQMPISRWTLVTDVFTEGTVWLDFQKGNERCHIRVTGGGLFSSTRIRVELWPIGPISAPKGPAGQ